MTIEFIPPKRVRIPPRGESVLRFVNNTILHNLRGETGNPTTIILPPLVERAYMIVYETSTIEYRDYPYGTSMRVEQ